MRAVSVGLLYIYSILLVTHLSNRNAVYYNFNNIYMCTNGGWSVVNSPTTRIPVVPPVKTCL